jgi:hypothetical protein
MTAPGDSNRGAWHALHPREALPWFAALRTRWWVAGGWALDLYLQRQTRPHHDLDIGILRRDAPQVLAHLEHWRFCEARDGALAPLGPQATPGPQVNSLWGRRQGSAQWELELLLDESQHDAWIYRRDTAICRPLTEAILHDAAGMPYLAPEIQLLYKSRAPRPRDEADFAATAPHLTPSARDWLRDSIATAAPAHPWIAMLTPRQDRA